MSIESLRQRIGLILFGVFLSLFLLELGLRAGGWFFLLHQERFNRKTSFQNNEFRVLCLGESTTALGGENSYPFQLQEILQQRRPDIRWVVINRGRVSKTSADILAELDKDLDQYRPQAVVTMIGINDPPLLPRQNSILSKVRATLRHSRAYHFFELLTEHLTHKWRSQKPIALDDLDPPRVDDLEKITKTLEGITKAIEKLQKQQGMTPQPVEEFTAQMRQMRFNQVMVLVGMGDYYLVRGKPGQAERVLSMAFRIAPENYVVLTELARCFRVQGQYPRAIFLLQKANTLQPQAVLGFVELGRCYEEMGQTEELYRVAREILKKGPEQFWAHPEVGSWLKKYGHLAEAEQFYLQSIQHNAAQAVLYQNLSEVYAGLGKKELSAEYHQKALEQRKKEDDYMVETAENYKQIAKKIISRGIKLVVMQYPLRRLEPLTEIFPPEWPVLFVENRKNFLAVLDAGSYADYFSDNFAGDFGHCRRLGNRLIAEQLAGVILQQVFL